MQFKPSMMFLTRGVGRHREQLASFELALRDAGIAAQNLVTVSSIFPPRCKLISRQKGLAMLSPGAERSEAEVERRHQRSSPTDCELPWSGDPVRPRSIRVPFGTS